MQEMECPPGTEIFHEGDESVEAYRIIQGEVDISIEGTDGKTQLLSCLGRGDVFGEMGMIDERPRSASATARTLARLQVIAEEDFEHAILTDIETLKGYLSALFERLRVTDTLLQIELGKRKQTPLPAKRKVSLNSLLHERGVLPDGETSAKVKASSAVRIQSISTDASLEQTPVDLEVTSFPFKIGRLSASQSAAVFASNDLSLPDTQPYQISRNHCTIEREDNGFILRDRGSTLGTILNGQKLGTRGTQAAAPLDRETNTLVLGIQDSPHQFRVTLL